MDHRHHALRLLVLAGLCCAVFAARAAGLPPEALQAATAALAATRGSADPRLYARAEAQLAALRAAAPGHPRLAALEAWMEMSRHRFAAALDHCEDALQTDPAEPIALALRADALTELGRYDEALAATQRLLDRAAPLVGLPRASHLRFLFGDTDGAVALAERALALAPPGHPEHAWLSGDLATLRVQQGRARAAIDLLEALPPRTPRERAWLARALLAAGDTEGAAGQWRLAHAVEPLPEYALALWKLSRARGDRREETRMARLLDGQARLDALQGGLGNRDFIEYQARAGRLADAEALARAEWQRRPDVYSDAQLAWVLGLAGQSAEAERYARRAQRLGTGERQFGEWLAGLASASPTQLGARP